jgi:hypothetical protein
VPLSKSGSNRECFLKAVLARLRHANRAGPGRGRGIRTTPRAVGKEIVWEFASCKMFGDSDWGCCPSPTAWPSAAEGEVFEPSEHLAMLNGFQVLSGWCRPVRLVPFSTVLSRVSCYLVVWCCPVLSGLQRVCSYLESAAESMRTYLDINKKWTFQEDLQEMNHHSSTLNRGAQ